MNFSQTFRLYDPSVLGYFSFHCFAKKKKKIIDPPRPLVTLCTVDDVCFVRDSVTHCLRSIYFFFSRLIFFSRDGRRLRPPGHEKRSARSRLRPPRLDVIVRFKCVVKRLIPHAHEIVPPAVEIDVSSFVHRTFINVSNETYNTPTSSTLSNM